MGACTSGIPPETQNTPCNIIETEQPPLIYKSEQNERQQHIATSTDNESDDFKSKQAFNSRSRSILRARSSSRSKSQVDTNTMNSPSKRNTNNTFLSIIDDNYRGQRDIYSLIIEGITCKPWYLSLNDNCSMDQVETIINYQLGLDMNTIRYKGKREINDSYKILIGDENVIDLDSNIFIIDAKTTFIKYWNKIYSKIYQQYPMKPPCKFDKLTDTLSINNINIQFQRTLRLPSIDYQYENDDDKKQNDFIVPPSLGSFPLKRLDEFKDIKIKTKYDMNNKDIDGIFILAMHKCEAMWMLFDTNPNVAKDTKSAVKLSLNGMNMINGQEFKSKFLTKIDEQNYIIVSNAGKSQIWIDGFNDGQGNIQQIAIPIDDNKEDDIDDNTEKEKEEVVDIDDLCTYCMEIQVFNGLNENVYVSYKDNDYFVEKNKTNNHLLYMKSEQLSLNENDEIYLYSSDISKMREITISDARNLSDSSEILFHHKQRNNDQYMNIDGDYIKWIQKGAYLDDYNYVVVNCNDGEEFRVLEVENGIESQISPVQNRITELKTDKDIKIKSYQTLSEQNIKLRSVLYGKCDKIEISIKYNNPTKLHSFSFELITKKSTTIKTLKSMIEDDKKIAMDIQQLIYHDEILNDDNKTVNDYSIINGSTVYLEILNKNKTGNNDNNRITDPFLKRQQEIGVFKNGKIEQIICPDIDDNNDIDNDAINKMRRNSISSFNNDEEKEEEQDEQARLSIKYDINDDDNYSSVIIYLIDFKILENRLKMNDKEENHLQSSISINSQTYEMYNYPYLKVYDD